MKSFFTLEPAGTALAPEGLAIEFYQFSKDLKLPFHLKDQLLRDCSSVAINLSEDSARPTVADRRKFYYVALGSLRECQCILRLHGQFDLILWQKANFLGVCVYKLCQAMK